MSGKKSKEKGKRGEREAARVLSSILNIPLCRGVQYQGSPDSPDISGLEDFGLHPEIKRDESTIGLKTYQALKQAVQESEGKIPFVMSRRNHREWLIVIEAKDLLQFCKAIIEADNAQ